MVKVAYTKCG